MIFTYYMSCYISRIADRDFDGLNQYFFNSFFRQLIPPINAIYNIIHGFSFGFWLLLAVFDWLFM